MTKNTKIPKIPYKLGWGRNPISPQTGCNKQEILNSVILIKIFVVINVYDLFRNFVNASGGYPRRRFSSSGLGCCELPANDSVLSLLTHLVHTVKLLELKQELSTSVHYVHWLCLQIYSAERERKDLLLQKTMDCWWSELQGLVLGLKRI